MPKSSKASGHNSHIKSLPQTASRPCFGTRSLEQREAHPRAHPLLQLSLGKRHDIGSEGALKPSRSPPAPPRPGAATVAAAADPRLPGTQRAVFLFVGVGSPLSRGRVPCSTASPRERIFPLGWSHCSASEPRGRFAVSGRGLSVKQTHASGEDPGSVKQAGNL